MLDSLQTINRVFEAGIAITALSLFLRSLTFNLRDRISRAFAVILACVMVSFSGEAVSATLGLSSSLDFWLRLQWVGTLFLPAAYMHFADALLETTGRPSRGRRRLLVRLTYLVSAGFVALLPTNLLLGQLVPNGLPVPHLTRTPLSWVFTAYYAVIMILALVTIWRAWQRTVLTASRRRMTYLLLGSSAVALGSYPFLILGSGMAARFPEIFFATASTGNIFVFWALAAMAYATAYFGVPWPDRVVKSRLFRWLLRGPVTVFLVLLLLPLVGTIGAWVHIREDIFLPILLGLSLLLIGHLLTLAAPILERWLFFSAMEDDVQFLQSLPERVLTDTDLRQFLEAVLASVCDRFQTNSAFVVALDQGQMQTVVEAGQHKLLSNGQLASDLLKVAEQRNGNGKIFDWGKFWLLPLHTEDGKEQIGMLGVLRKNKGELSEGQREALHNLGERAALAIDDRRQQSRALRSLEILTPRVEVIQRLRAASRYDQSEVMSEVANLPEYSDLVKWVKDALTHYWGGPRLTQSPLRGMQIVQRALTDNSGNPAQAMRSILGKAIERNKPEGPTKLNGEWLLYNLLEMKFMQGRKVRDVAMRLAMSEADLYRKQRVAIETVARSLLEMEKDALEQQNGKEEVHG